MSDKTGSCDVILKAMVAMASADGHLDSREVGLIQDIFKDCTGKALGADAVARAAHQNEAEDIRNVLADLAPSLDLTTKDEILCAAYRVLLADNRVAGEERKELHEMARALHISEIHLSALLEELAASLHE
ncbi:TerB family tellurite resistance protein [Methyloceanibacter sp. wino2]|uniref:TerB family tellurite resistance protein n=1 Tax=Methyloceanibacter sp. wino2 TaxID=2170729 RepID=UPI001FE19997|nr:TerB family tellurite resistance protein [Methyloceanibacter sp. wino2]